MATGGDPSELQGHADRLRPRRDRRETRFKSPGAIFGEFFGEIHGDPVRVAPGAEGEGVELLLDGGDYRRIGEADLVDVVPWKSM